MVLTFIPILTNMNEMAYKDPEKQKEKMRELMKARRAAAKEKAGVISNDTPDKISEKHRAGKQDIQYGTQKQAPAPPPTQRKEEIELEPQIDMAKRKPEGRAPCETAQAPALASPARDTVSEYSQAEQEAARDLVDRSKEIIEQKGWVIWKCANLKNDLIVVIKDSSLKNYPSGYPVYTFKDLNEIAGLSDRAIRTIHQVKVAALQTGLPGLVEVMPRGNKN